MRPGPAKACWDSGGEPCDWPEGSTRLTAGLDAKVSGTITNPLPVDIEEAYLVYDRTAYRLGRLAPGMTIPFDDMAAVDLQTLLTRRKVVQGHNVVTPWDPNSTDVDRVMQLMMFYQRGKRQGLHAAPTSLSTDWSTGAIT